MGRLAMKTRGGRSQGHLRGLWGWGSRCILAKPVSPLKSGSPFQPPPPRNGSHPPAQRCVFGVAAHGGVEDFLKGMQKLGDKS